MKELRIAANAEYGLFSEEIDSLGERINESKQKLLYLTLKMEKDNDNRKSRSMPKNGN